MAIGLQPLSYLWGTDRGFPVHRYYLEQFLSEFTSDIRGSCLEFQDPQYASRFGGSAVVNLAILHIDDSNPKATLAADLTKPNGLPSDQFDCVVCTHVLHVIFEVEKAVSEIFRLLKPGGVLLVAVPHVSMCDPDYHEIWRFTPEGLEVLLARTFGSNNVTVRAYGNSLTAAGEIRGVVVQEFAKSELDNHDPRFAVEVCARAIKPG
jgi:SAM-dependent methyltransferase